MRRVLVLFTGLFLIMLSTRAQSVLMSYYGTANDAARENNIDKLNQIVAQRFNNLKCAEAYTSDMVIKALKKRGIKKQSIGEALQNLRSRKQPIVIANVQLLDGVMTDKLKDAVRESKINLDSISMTKPLLYNSDDCKWLANVLSQHIKADHDTEIVLVGHGSDDSANATYALVDYIMQQEGKENFHVGTIEGYPDLNAIKQILKKRKAQKVILFQLLLIAGNHALQDINGTWKSELEKEGYKVTVAQEGLLELTEVQQRIIGNIEKEIDNLTY